MGGSFNSINGTAVSLVAKTDLNGAVTDTLNGGLVGVGVNCLLNTSSALYVGGDLSYNQVSTTTTLLHGIGKYNTSTGTWSGMGGGLSRGLRGYVYTMDSYDSGSITIGGTFTTDKNSNDMFYVTKYDITNNAFAPLQDVQITPYGVNGTVKAIETVGNYIYVGGYFTIAGEISATNVARYNITSKKWESLAGIYTFVENGTSIGEGAGDGGGGVNALYWDSVNGRLFVGGYFTTVQNSQVIATNVAYWTPGANSSACGIWSPLNGNGGEGVFNDGGGGEVFAITGDGTNIYVGGNFQYAYISGYITGAYNVAYWSSFAWHVLSGENGGAGTGGIVYALAWVESVLPDISGLFLGGEFQYVEMAESGATALANYVALWSPTDGGKWGSLYQGVGGMPGTTSAAVRALAWDGSKLFIGGSFNGVNWHDGSSAQTYGYQYMVAWSPTIISWPIAHGLWYDAGASMDGAAYSLNYVNGRGIYVGGAFTTVAGITVNRAALMSTQFGPATWGPLPPTSSPEMGLNATVYSIKYYASNNSVITGGEFTIAQEANSSVTTNRVAYFGLNTWYPLKETVLPYGVKPGGWMPAKIYAIAVDIANNLMYVGGDFINAGGIYASNIARYNYSTQVWYPLIDSNTKTNGMNASVRALLLDGTNLYAGGEFTTAGGTTVNRIAKWSSGVWSPLASGSPSTPGTSGTVYCITRSDTDFYVGGSFSTAGGTTVNNVAKWNGTTWSPLTGTTGAGTNGIVYAILYYPGLLSNSLIIGGSFTDAGGQAVSNVAIWCNYNSSGYNFIPLQESSNQGTSGTVYALSRSNVSNLIYIGGDFTAVANGNVSANYVASWTWSGSGTSGTWLAVGNNMIGGVVKGLTYDTSSSKLYIGGAFTTGQIRSYGFATPVNRIVAFNDGGGGSTIYDTLPTSSASSLMGAGANGTDGPVYAICSTSDYVFVGGEFQVLFNNSSANLINSLINSHNIGIISKMNNTWIITTSPIPKLNGVVRTVKQTNPFDIYVGGDFTALSGGNQDLNYIAKWNATTRMWYSVTTSPSSIGMDNSVYDIKKNTEHSLYIGGAFTSAGTNTLNRIGMYEILAKTWTQFTSLGGSDIGVNGIVRNINCTSPSTAHICGDFTSTSASTGSLSISRVAGINSSNKIYQIKNGSGTHTGFNNTVNVVLKAGSNVYFSGQFTNTSPTSDLPVSRISSYIITQSPITLTTATNGFLDTDDGGTYAQIILPLQYKAVTLVYDSTINQWLETYRSSGVTH